MSAIGSALAYFAALTIIWLVLCILSPMAAVGWDAADLPHLNSTVNGKPDEMYDPTPHAVVAQMLDLARVGPGDTLIDLGCGDGRIPIAAAKRGARAIGIDIDPAVLIEARRNAKLAGVTVEWREGNLFTTDLRGVTVVALYLSPRINALLWPKLRAEAPGTRVVSYSWDTPGVPASRIERAVVADPRSTPDRDLVLLWERP